MANALITTIIPTFRRPLLLRRAIVSVLEQSFKNLKICIYDNANKDKTEDVVAEFIRHDDRIFYFKNSQNIGAVNNIIQGVDAVTTEYYSILNDDDFLLPDFYENAMRKFESHPRSGFVCAKTITVDLVNKKMQFRNRDWLHGAYQPSNETTSKMYNSHFTQTGVLMRRGMRQLIGPFEKSGDDRLYMTMAAASSPFIVLDYYGAVYTIHPRSFSTATGLAGNDFNSVCETLLSTLINILNITLPTEEKIHLLMLAINAYGGIFDFQKFNQFIEAKDRKDKSVVISLPSRITTHGFFTKIYEIAPERVHPVITHCAKLIMGIKKIAVSKKAKNNWLELPKEANSFFFNYDVNVSRFLSSIQHGNMQSRKNRGLL